MKNINILDCTLRDGGYVNNWEFGQDNIHMIINKLEESGAEIIEMGFLRDEAYAADRAIFSGMEDVTKILTEKKDTVKYAVLVEMANYFPLEKLEPYQNQYADIIRYSFWKRKLDEGYEYAKRIRELGYDLFVQPTRAEQYSKEEFRDMVQRFATLNPKAVYIVDTFGLLTKAEVEMYAHIADESMPKDIMLGYHAHNNMQQALGNAMHLAELGLDRKLTIDSSVFGMGRGAGNLSTEIWMNYLNENFSKNYTLALCYEIYDNCLKGIYDECAWGYNLAYYLTALNRCNPSYATYFLEHGYSVMQMKELLDRIPYDEKIRYSEDIIRQYSR